MKIKEIALAKEALKQINDLLTDEDQRLGFRVELDTIIMNSSDATLIENYFRLIDYLNNLFPDDPYDNDIILELFDHNFEGIESTKEYRDHIVPFFTAAIKAGNKDLIDHVMMIWDAEQNLYNKPEDQWLVDEMNSLIEKAKLI